MIMTAKICMKRICKFCKGSETSTVQRGGAIIENWYIDRYSPEGGWLCNDCYVDRRKGIETKIIAQFNVWSTE